MVELMTTMQDLILGKRIVVAQTAAAQTRPSPLQVAHNSTSKPSTSAVPPPAQTRDRKIAPPSGEQAKQPKLIPTATYKRRSTKANKIARVEHADSSDAGTDPLTDISPFDLIARGASTKGVYCSAASGLITKKLDYHTAVTASANTNPPILSFREIPPRPVASSTQRKVNARKT